jgi:hypothetical protein
VTAPPSDNTAKDSLRAAAIYCLAAWVGVWLLFLLIRLSRLDIRVVPGIGPFMLSALVVSFLAPIVATALAVASLIRRPGVLLNWLVPGCALAALTVQAFVFLSSRWM